MHVGAAVLNVFYDGAGLTIQPELNFQPIDRAVLLLGAQNLVRRGIDIGVIERPAAARAGRNRLHVRQRAVEVVRHDAAHFEDEHLLVRVDPLQVCGQVAGAASRAAINHHSRAPV
jgi:hypothetical protein